MKIVDAELAKIVRSFAFGFWVGVAFGAALVGSLLSGRFVLAGFILAAGFALHYLLLYIPVVSDVQAAQERVPQ